MKKWELLQKQSLPLEAKIIMAQSRIREWYEYWDGRVYVSFSGGKDSTVLLHLVRGMYPDVPAVFADTGLEYPEIRDFVSTVEGVTWIKPKLSFKQVLDKYGYPVISKEQAQFIYEYRTTKSEKVRNMRWKGNKWYKGKIAKRWRFMVDAPFKISDKCCDFLKKNPFRIYERLSRRVPYLGTLVEESSQRLQSYFAHGCNIFNQSRPVSRPLSVWVEKDIWDYLRAFNVRYSSIYDKGFVRTGCIFCLFGVHMEEEPNRFQRMAKTHPQLHKYCMENLGIKEVLEFMNIKTE